MDVCSICEENPSYYKKLCINCVINCIDNQQLGIKNIDFLLHISKEYNTSDIPLSKIKLLNNLACKLLSNAKKEIEFDDRIHVKCKCDKKHQRNLKYGSKPHKLYCKKCGYYCSNCRENHYFSFPLGKLDCKKYKTIVDKANTVTYKLWKSELCNNTKERKRKIIEEYNQNVKMKGFLKSEDTKICPFCTREGARKFEMHQFSHGRITKDEMLTEKYITEEEWEKVKCKSEGFPVTKVHCDDVTCGSHNKERRLFLDGISKKCCGRRINWQFWTPFEPKFEKIKEIEFTEIVEKSCQYSVIEKYDCDICKKNRNIISIFCTESKCKYKHKRICTSCLVNINEQNWNVKPNLVLVNEITNEIYHFIFILDSYEILESSSLSYNHELKRIYIKKCSDQEILIHGQNCHICFTKSEFDINKNGIYKLSFKNNSTNETVYYIAIVSGNPADNILCLEHNHTVLILDNNKINEIMSENSIVTGDLIKIESEKKLSKIEKYLITVKFRVLLFWCNFIKYIKKLYFDITWLGATSMYGKKYNGKFIKYFPSMTISTLIIFYYFKLYIKNKTANKVFNILFMLSKISTLLSIGIINSLKLCELRDDEININYKFFYRSILSVFPLWITVIETIDSIYD